VSGGRANATRGVITGLLLASIGTAQPALAQDNGRESSPVEVWRNVNVNTKGISQVPALTLGRPAAVFDLAVRKGDASFEPQFRFGLDGEPWSFLLWGRYRAVTGEKFRLTVGAHPAFSFRTTSASIGGAERDVIEVKRYLAGELSPSYALSPTASVGAYYLYARGIDPGAPKHTHLVAARTNMANVEVLDDYVLQLAPQVYFLRTNGQNGTYVSASASFARRDWPFSIATIVNQPIRTDVAGGKDFLWNVSLNYSFR
jgi:hypothetical protein